MRLPLLASLTCTLSLAGSVYLLAPQVHDVARAQAAPTSSPTEAPDAAAPQADAGLDEAVARDADAGSGMVDAAPPAAAKPDAPVYAGIADAGSDAGIRPRKRPLKVQSEAQKASFIKKLLARMTLEEKAGQLTMWGAQQSPTGPLVRVGSDAEIRSGRVGSFIGAWGAGITYHLQKVAVEESRLHIPLLFSFDVIHGFDTTFPVPLAEASSFDPELARRTARWAALEATAAGLHWTFAPMVDIARDPRWGRVVEGSGEDPFLGSALAAARVQGFAGTDDRDPTRILSTAKHFVGYGAAQAGRDYNTVDMSDRMLHEVYLPPFRAAIAAGVDTVMPAFNEIAGTPMHGSRELTRELLRNRLGFEGIVVSDFTGIMELTVHGIAADPAEAAVRAMGASVDIDMLADYYLNELPGLVKSGRVPQKELDDAVRRVLEAKQELGLFDDPYRYIDSEREQRYRLNPLSRVLAREAGQKSIVLLKNERDLLPLSKNAGTLAVIGALAEDRQSTFGAWAGIGKIEQTVTVLEGIQEAVSPDTKVLYTFGASPDSESTSGFAEAERIAALADTIVLVFGENELMTGEAHNRASIDLPGSQLALLNRLSRLNKPIVLVLMNGRPLALTEAVERSDAVLETWYLGHEMGHSVADVLFGDVNPSGKVPITFPRSGGQIPLFYAHKNTGRPPREEEAFSSKYLDEKVTPLFPFGYGLSYTTFSYDAPKLSKTEIEPTESITVDVTVRNTGKRAGEEIVQLYLRDDVATFTRPVRQLRGFAKVPLEPGEAKTVTFTLDQDDFALLDKNLERVVEPGNFTVWVGGSSLADNRAEFKVLSGAKLQGMGDAVPEPAVIH